MAVKPTVLKAVWIVDETLYNRMIDFFIDNTEAKPLRPPDTQYTGQDVVFADHSAFIDKGKYNLEVLRKLANMPQLKILVILFDPGTPKEAEIFGSLKEEGFSLEEINPMNGTNVAFGLINSYRELHNSAEQLGFNPALPQAPKYGEIEPVKKFAEGFVLVTDVSEMPQVIESVFGTKVYNYDPEDPWSTYNNQPLILVNKFEQIKKKSDVFSVNRKTDEGNTDKTTVVAISKKKVGVPEGVRAYQFEYENGNPVQYAEFFSELGNRITRPDYFVIRNKKKEDKPPERDDKGPRALRRRKKHDEE